MIIFLGSIEARKIKSESFGEGGGEAERGRDGRGCCYSVQAYVKCMM